MKKHAEPVIILFAEDDDDDFMLASEALRERKLLNAIRRVKDGEELMDYLLHRGAYSDIHDAGWPTLILLDLNMPKKDGREALEEIKAHPVLRRIPIIIMTTSQVEEDILRSYELGVSSFIRKPVSFNGLCDVMTMLERYWLEIVVLPPTP